MTKRLFPTGCSPQVEVKSRKTKENGISHLRGNSPHSSDKGILTSKPIFTQGVSEKLLTMQCSPFSLAILGHPVFIINKTNTRTKRFTLNFHKIPALVEFPAPRQLSKVKSRPPGHFFRANPRGLPGGDVPSWN